MKNLIILLFALLIFGCDTRDSITRFSEDNHMDREYYVYPSTLRMINLEQNEDFNELIEDLVKGRYFSIEKKAESKELIDGLRADLVEEGFEEVMTFHNSKADAGVYILDARAPRIAAIIELENEYNVIDVEGMLNVTKIPQLLENFDDEKFLNIIDITQRDKNKHRVEQHTQNKQPD